MQPVGDARGERRDDDLVVTIALQRSRDGREWVLGADESFDAAAGRLLEQRNGELERDGRLLGVGIPERPRHEQREPARARDGPPADLREQGGRRGGAVGDDQDVARSGYDHPFVVLLADARVKRGLVQLTPLAFARHVTDALPDSQHVELDCGHVPQVELPRQTHAAVSRFLAR